MNELKSTAVVLAGGAGTRMRSRRSKVLHELAGRPLIHYPVLAAAGAGASKVVVVASPHNREDIEGCLALLSDVPVSIVVQERPLGTGDAVRAALPALDSGPVMILCGDVPLVEASDLRALQTAYSEQSAALAIASCELADPTGYGRILRDDSARVVAIREHRDLQGDAQRTIKEVNSGIYLIDAEPLREALSTLNDDNSQGEYYLTDIVEHLARTQLVVAALGDPAVMQGVNDRAQLAALEGQLLQRIADRHRRAGVTVQQGAWIADTVEIGSDSHVGAGAVLRGASRVGSGVRIDHGCVITDSVIEDDAALLPYTVITESHVGPGCKLGPFAHLRPGSHLQAEVHIGNFVETKKTTLRRGAKANHLSYLGDGDVGAGSNIGAGTIFCNYDGFSKARTSIGEGVFVGSDSQLVAPVSIGDGAYVGTGTTVTEDVPAGALALGRVRQVNKLGYAEPLREKLRKRSTASKGGG